MKQVWVLLDGIYWHFSLVRPDRAPEDLGVVHQKNKHDSIISQILLCRYIMLVDNYGKELKNSLLICSYFLKKTNVQLNLEFIYCE